MIRPDWPAPVGALCSTRAGGVSGGPYAALNLGVAVGDKPAAVAANRERFAGALNGAQPLWLRQVHGAKVVKADAAALAAAAPEADAAWTDEPGVACVVQVADCLPVLLAHPQGRGVAAAHAGWRGLAGGVIDAAVVALCEGTGADPGDLLAWLGPCIGLAAFEVGADVLDAFADDAAFFVHTPRANGDARWHADLAGLARRRLFRLGPRRVHGGGWCTVNDPSRFFSYRRDGVTGRLAAAIWRHA
ncbi:MAG: peptidoglycan editing factor PgeF [Burkholderiaceae bacterium]|nr:peptidoglycan editing factor PgeF [Burkholderiaceae bacterium]